ncbi:hypothetical protein [Leucobacter denitrificans]|uniref:Multidrug ABC transporter ATPase n=1 Tax=Leucobacter denitrificans TaxID=683042 RepID=A0A7G9S3Y6_9MICO|nr:hypothetical protein [Leucobacter denitrificans]QNN62561.1 hypothetical protein H9L06_09980 [Leucobacter denitrificans]
MSTEDHSTPSRFERVLAYVTITIIVAALGSYFATLIVGMNDREAVAEGLWAWVFGISLYALPVGFVLLILLLILAQRRRSRDARQGKS